MAPRQYDERSIEEIRTRVVDLLATYYARGTLDVEEYERRVETATNSISRGALESLVSELPALQSPDSASPPAPRSAYQGEVAESSGVRDNQTFVNVFSGISKGGAWRPARRTMMVNVFGGGDLDLRDAILPGDSVTINVVCVFGGADIIVPEDVNVETNGFALFGGFDSKVPEGRRYDAPTIHVNGFCLFGGVDVKTKSR